MARKPDVDPSIEAEWGPHWAQIAEGKKTSRGIIPGTVRPKKKPSFLEPRWDPWYDNYIQVQKENVLGLMRRQPSIAEWKEKRKQKTSRSKWRRAIQKYDYDPESVIIPYNEPPRVDDRTLARFARAFTSAAQSLAKEKGFDFQERMKTYLVSSKKAAEIIYQSKGDPEAMYYLSRFVLKTRGRPQIQDLTRLSRKKTSKAARAISWLVTMQDKLTPRALAILGNLTPEVGQYIANKAWKEHPGRISAKKLDLEEAQRLEQMIARTRGDARKRILAAISQLSERLITSERIEPGPLSLSFPEARREISALIALGQKPSDIYPGLTPREAHEYVASGTHLLPIEWLLNKHEIDIYTRSFPVARWLIAVKNDPRRYAAFTRVRNIKLPSGRTIRLSLEYMSRSIRDEYLVNGTQTSVERVLDAIIKNEGDDIFEKYCYFESAEPPKWWKPLPYANILTSSTMLNREGKEMSHCVGGYARDVQEGNSAIVSFRKKDEETGKELRATAEINPKTGYVRQFYGPENTEPHPEMYRLLEEALEYWGLPPLYG